MKWGIALSGGGAPGVAAHLGFMETVLIQGKLHPDVLVGTSAGGIVAGSLGAGVPILQQVDAWTGIANDPWALIPDEVMHRRGLLQRSVAPGLISLGPVVQRTTNRRKLNSSANDHGVPVKSWKQCHGVIVSDYNLGAPILVHADNDLGLFTDQALVATAAIPGIVSGVRTPEGHLLQDGGLFDNDPVQACRGLGAEKVVLVMVGRGSRVIPAQLNVFELLQLTVGEGLAWGTKLDNRIPADLTIPVPTTGNIIDLTHFHTDFQAGVAAAKGALDAIAAISG